MARTRGLVIGVVLLLAGACAGAPAAVTSATSATSATSTTSATAAPPGSTAVARPEVTAMALTIDDPVLGPLTFDALAAGDPAAAAAGRLVVLLHGFPETAESYRSFLPALAAEGYYAVAYSQRGYSPGARPEAVARYGIVEIIGDLLRVVDRLGARTFHVVGHDWGGGVAWAVAALQPARVTTLTVLSTPHPDALSRGIGDPDDPQHLASAYMDTFREAGSEDRLLADGAASFRAVFGPGAGGLPADKVDAYARVLATPPALRAALNWYRANPLDHLAPLGRVQVPTLYLWGSADGAFVRSTVERTRGLVAGEYSFVELPGHGHWLPEDATDEVLARLLPHLAAHAATRGIAGSTGSTAPVAP